jgi:FkbM family methyltransferase
LERDELVSRALEGVFRSLRGAHGAGARQDAMDALFRRFVEPGDLVFDGGALAGDGVSSFRRLGARVIAIEPQSLFVDALSHIHGRDPLVVLVRRALNETTGKVLLRLNSDHPGLSTISDAFIARAATIPDWDGLTWDESVDVEAVTLDALIARYGTPAFIRIHAVGYEDAVLRGLSHPVKALSFNFVAIMRDIAAACLERLSLLGDYRYNLSIGENHTLAFDQWSSVSETVGHLFNLPRDVTSGDIYAALAVPQ